MEATAETSKIVVKSRGVWQAPVRTQLHVRQFEPFYSDEPEELGGRDTGPSPMEYMVAAVNGCVSVMIHLIAEEMGLAYQAAELEIEGDLDVRGLKGAPNVDPHFQAMRLQIRIKTRESRERLEELREQVERRCPGVRLIRAANVPFEISWHPV